MTTAAEPQTHCDLVSTRDGQTHPFHKLHNGPRVILLSDDNVAFGVDLECLVKYSAVFAANFNVSQTSSGDDSDTTTSAQAFDHTIPISMFASTSVLDHFVNMIKASRPHLPLTDLPDTIGLLKLFKKFEFDDSIIARTQGRLEDLGKKEPWRLLQIASHEDDDTCRLGDIAWKYLTWRIFIDGDDKKDQRTFWERIESLSPTWRVRILNETLGDPTKCHLKFSDTVKLCDPIVRNRFWTSVMDSRLDKVVFAKERADGRFPCLHLWCRALFLVAPICLDRRENFMIHAKNGNIRLHTNRS